MAEDVKIVLSESELPQHWYNLAADLPERLPPPLNPRTHLPLEYGDMASLTPRDLTLQEVSTERYIEIPDDVLRAYRQWRPTPLYRAGRWRPSSAPRPASTTSTRGCSPTGSHKVNTAVPQVYYNAQRGVRRLTTETGAGQWGTALAFACAQFDVECEVWWAGASYDQKPYRKTMMETFGATVHRSPSPVPRSAARRSPRTRTPTGSIGLAVSEAVEVALADSAPAMRWAAPPATCCYTRRSSVRRRCASSPRRGLPGRGDQLRRWRLQHGRPGLPVPAGQCSTARRSRVVAAEPTALPRDDPRRYALDYGDREGMTPLMKMYTVGHSFVPDPIHAGGLRYHGMAPLVSYAYNRGLIEAAAWPQSQCFEAGLLFARTEGIVPAPESIHGIAAAIADAEVQGDRRGEGDLRDRHRARHFDLSAYDDYLAGNLVDAELTDEQLQESLSSPGRELRPAVRPAGLTPNDRGGTMSPAWEQLRPSFLGSLAGPGTATTSSAAESTTD